MGKNIGFISTRFAGTDGVTLEASKWAQVLRSMGHNCYWFAGQLDKDPAISMLVPRAFFQDEKNLWINARILGHKRRDDIVTDAIHETKVLLKRHIREFIQKFDIDLIIPQNALTIPMHVPLGMAITEIIAETQIPTIAHHHDFYWERTRFAVNAVNDYLRMAFPPNLPGMEHVVINSAAQEELALRTGCSSIIIPNILEFEHPPKTSPATRSAIRSELGFKEEDIVFLQPTRIVQRKGIEHAINLVRDLNDPRCKLLISHEAGDEGYEYAEWLRQEAREMGVDLRMLNISMRDPWNDTGAGHPAKSLLDIYPCADWVTYPSLYEGFGNAFLEAVYFRKPVLINRYAIFVRDIEPKGFDLIAMDGFLTEKTVSQVRDVLGSTQRIQRMVEHNFEIASRHYSYGVLRRWLNTLMVNFFGFKSENQMAQ
ncbi:glycosyl transferase [Desulfosarcina widdelii]|uniref:Glycosyl transferase n=1 Tax=Desulfosarcina widdelii TaxID=947919 RepID=A0A5K7Z740_9BACT|nr:glycosyltransferase family 4 protein [Desulfosarcina widdelii]BBO74284.1 glycosyl transferase [Desulfosarcina widdelii]